jgi:lysozyme family protein
MQTNFEKSLAHVLTSEGGWSDNPADPGGATMKGVTIAVYRQYYGATKTKTDLHNISDAELAHIYKTGYWDKCRGDDLPAGVDYAVFDAAVNSGPGRAAKWLQGAVGATQDGIIGPDTLSKVAGLPAAQVIDKFCDQRLSFLQGLSTWKTFGNGWGRRVEEVRATAKGMAGGVAS